MSAVPSRRSRRALYAGVAVALTLVLSSCTHQRDPTGYSDSVRENFVEGCTAPDGVAADGLPEDTCGCIYDYFDENVPWSEFSSSNSDRRTVSDPAVLEGGSWAKAYEACGVSVGGGLPTEESVTTTSGDATTTTTAG
ncbi:MAG: hypothetical protein KF906_00925 [Actinobacteria bacterium]|nr:hypothetical protein [Actinomycetota bacterium]